MLITTTPPLEHLDIANSGTTVTNTNTSFFPQNSQLSNAATILVGEDTTNVPLSLPQEPDKITLGANATVGELTVELEEIIVLPSATFTCQNPITVERITLKHDATLIYQPPFQFDGEPLKGTFYVKEGDNFTIKSNTGFDIKIFETKTDGSIREYNIQCLETVFTNWSLENLPGMLHEQGEIEQGSVEGEPFDPLSPEKDDIVLAGSQAPDQDFAE